MVFAAVQRYGKLVSCKILRSTKIKTLAFFAKKTGYHPFFARNSHKRHYYTVQKLRRVLAPNISWIDVLQNTSPFQWRIGVSSYICCIFTQVGAEGFVKWKRS